MQLDASDPKQVADAKAAAGRRAKADEDAIKKFLESGDARSWTWRFLERCHIFATIVDDPEATHTTAFRLGERNIGLMLLSEIMRAAPESYMLMAKESKENA